MAPGLKTPMDTTPPRPPLAKVVPAARAGDGLFRVTGDSGGCDAQRFVWDGIVRQATTLGARRIHVLEDLPTSGFDGVLDAVAAAIARGIGRFRVALVDLNAGAQSFAEFGGMLPRNRGIDARVFRSEAEAERWLTLDDGPARD
jgi:hypothetical protein